MALDHDVDGLLDTITLPDDLRAGVCPGLEAAMAALANETSLDAEARARAVAQFRNNLDRLSQIAADRQRHPEIRDVRIERPVFILGLPRCGTSLLHALIGTDRTVRTPLSWEVAAPSPPPDVATFDTDPRANAFDDYVDANFQGKWADVRKAHPIGARIPQECGMILETAFQSLNLTMLFRLRDYYSWYLQADTRFGYQVHKLWLQHLAWKNPRRRFVLKVQEHMYHLPELLSVYPDAVFVQPHRDPVTVMASISRLIEVIRSVVFEHQDRAELGEELLHLWHDGQVRMMAYRKEHPDLPIHDMRYKDIARDPVGAVHGIYDFAGIDFTSETETGIRAWLTDNPSDKHGRHSYTLGDYGLTEQRVRDVYADYIATYSEFI
ncbi:MAG: sulfotransferase family protein [Janthinobacterium lividum]